MMEEEMDYPYYDNDEEKTELCFGNSKSPSLSSSSSSSVVVIEIVRDGKTYYLTNKDNLI